MTLKRAGNFASPFFIRHVATALPSVLAGLLCALAVVTFVLQSIHVMVCGAVSQLPMISLAGKF